MIRVFVIAPTPIAQAGLHALLATEDIQVVGSAPIAEDADALPAFDVIVIADDGQLEDIGRSLAPALVVLTNNGARALQILRQLDLRGWSILSMEAPAEQLQAAVVSAARGLAALPAQLASVFQLPQPITVKTMNMTEVDEALTPREREVLELVSQGLSNKLIARSLHISEHTVKFHISSLSAKLGASSRTDAVRLGLRRGLITL